MAMQLTKDELDNAFQTAMFNAIKKEIKAGREREEVALKQRRANEAANDRYQNYLENVQKYEEARKHMQRGLSAMDSCHTIFFDIFELSKHLAERLQFELEEEIRHKWDFNVPKIPELAKKIIHAMIEKSAQDDPNVFLPGILHFVELTKESELDKNSLRFTYNLKFDDGSKVNPQDPAYAKFLTLLQERDAWLAEANSNFNKELKEWLNTQGYRVDPADKKVKNAAGVVLTPDAFAKLRDDPTKGLTAHLKKQWKVEDIKQEKEPSPSPRGP